MNLRKIFFWTHLVSGLTAGLVIALLALTGLTLSFEPQIIDFVERDVRRIPAAAGAEKTSIEDLMKYIREEHPDARPTGFTLYSDPQAAIVFPAGRGLTFYVDPNTEAIKEAGSAKLRGFFNFTLGLHRYLALSGDQRSIAAQIIGVATFIFLSLSITGLVIWWPRKWTWRSLRPSVWFTSAKGKARDWNWHNVIGLWTTPLLIVICITGLMISYRWVGNLAFILTGNPVPVARGQANPEAAAPGAAMQPGSPAATPDSTAPTTTPAAASTAPAAPEAPANALPPVVVPTPPKGARPLAYAPLLAKVRETYPNWTQITLRAGGNQRQQRRPAAPAAGAPAASSNPPTSAPATDAPREAARPADGERPANPPAAAPAGGARTPRAPQPVSVTIRTSDMWFSTSSLTLSLDPYTGDILRTQGFGDQNLGRRIRSLAVPVHMGTIAGWPTQLLAAIGALGALFLVYTGFALSWRRFFGKNSRKKTKPAPGA